ncbi:hypothetical protein LEMLEM_LOCUS22982 [Lemmus lemmus]
MRSTATSGRAMKHAGDLQHGNGSKD